ncbi:MAG: glycosyltransferase [Propionibacteriaceae bacterium]|nr:glycosyltransferase [Propionibacteriaceae bacterium]
MPTRRSRIRYRRGAPTNLSDLNIASELSESGPVEERREATRNRNSPVVVAMTILATLGVVAYTAFLLQIDNRGDLLPWLLVLGAELILVFLGLMSMWTMLAGYNKGTTFAFHEAQGRLYNPKLNDDMGIADDATAWPLFINRREVDVDVYITVFGEELKVIRKTVTAALAMKGRHETYVLDDGDSDDVRDLAAELGAGYIRRLGGSGAKAGNVNHALAITHGEFFLILDADFVVKPEMLEETLPAMADDNIAFVQTPQVYGNLHTTIARGAAYMQSMFYRYIQPGRNEFNAAFCVGTNVLFRRKAVKEIGGMYTGSKSEDVWTSLLLHERGWKSLFIDQALAVGEAPDTIEAYSKQQLRWATGGFEILLTHNPLSPRRRLTLDQRLMYFVTATHYLSGIATGLLLFVPALEIFFDLRPISLAVGPLEWALYYSGFYVLQILLSALILGTFRPEVLLLAAASFPIYIKAFRNALFGIDVKWSVTGTTGGRTSSFNFILPQLFAFVFLLVTSAVAIWRDVLMSTPNVATFWCVINTIVLGLFVLTAWREDRQRAHTAPTRAHIGASTDEKSAPILTTTLDRDVLVAAHNHTKEVIS